MKSNELKTTSKTAPKRKGRGISAGQGKTAGRGTKGQNSRTGGRRRPGFEGGQTPLFMRIPKARGFNPRHAAATLTLSQLSRHQGDTVTIASLVAQDMIDAKTAKVKIVASGQLKGAFKLGESVRATKSAADAITKAGGTTA